MVSLEAASKYAAEAWKAAADIQLMWLGSRVGWCLWSMSQTLTFCLIHTHTLMCKDTGSVRKISIKFIATSPHIPSCSPPVDRLLLSSAADRQAVLIHRSSRGTIKVVSTVLHNFLLLRSFIIPFVAHPDFHTLRERNAYNRGGWVTVQKSDLFPDGNA